MSFLVHKNFFGFRPLVCQFAPVSARKIEFFVNLDGGSCRTTFGSTKRLQNNTLHKSWWDLPFLCFTLQLLLFLCWHSEKKSIKPEARRIDLFASFLPPFPFTTKLSKSPSFFSLETAGAFAERKKKILQCLSKAEEAFSASLHFKDAMMVYFKKGFLRIYSDLRRLFFQKKRSKLPMTSLLMAFYLLLCIESCLPIFLRKLFPRLKVW